MMKELLSAPKAQVKHRCREVTITVSGGPVNIYVCDSEKRLNIS